MGLQLFPSTTPQSDDLDLEQRTGAPSSEPSLRVIRDGGSAPTGRGTGEIIDCEESSRLMERVQQGSVDAFEQVVEIYWRPTLLYARQLSGDHDRAYDVTQDTFIRLWERRRTWTKTGSVRVWLLRTARNLTLNNIRSWRVRARRALEVAQEYRTVRTPLQDAERLELGEAIKEAVSRLSPRRRTAFTLFHLQGLTYREISGIMGVRPQTVANYLQAALADMRVLLAPHYRVTDTQVSVRGQDEIEQEEGWKS